MSDSSLLLELGVPFSRGPNGLLVEAQALNGLHLWASHFDRITVCAIEQPADQPDSATVVWADPSALLAEGRVTFEPLPWAYHPRDHFRVRGAVRQRFRALVPSHRYRCFSNLGVFGAWGNIAADEARQQNLSYSLWFDWVLHAMGSNGPIRSLRDIKNRILTTLTQRRTAKAIRGCALGLFHGQTVYDAYAPLCSQPQLVHDIHVHPEDAISDAALAEKLAASAVRDDIRIGYVGRVHPMKAPLQWIDAVGEVVARVGAARVQAEWLGDGPLLEAARQRVAERGLEASIRFSGFVSDRETLLTFLRRQDVMAFCHVTPESPRCLIEALISGTPIVGYESGYARELVGDRGGALLSPMSDPRALAAHLLTLISDRQALEQLTRAAAASRTIYNDAAVFKHRSDLIKRYL